MSKQIHSALLLTLLIGTTLPLSAQQVWTEEDSLRLDRLLRSGEPLKFDLLIMEEKPWMDFDETLPIPSLERRDTLRLTLKPYKPNTPYNWDPVLRRKIRIDTDTWRGDPFYNIKQYAQKKAKATARYNSSAYTGDLMYIFTKECWDVKGKRRRKRTQKALKEYGDSITVKRRPSADSRGISLD